MMNVEERYKKYFVYLHKVFEETKGSERFIVDKFGISKILGWGGEENEEIHDIVFWLMGEGLLESVDIGRMIRLTHFGIKEVEDAIRHPDRETALFPSNIINIINTGSMTITSPIQQGNVDSTQNVTISSEQTLEVCKLINSFKELLKSSDLTSNQKQELEPNVKALESEITGKPKKESIKSALISIKEILKDVTPAAGLTMQIMNLLGNLN